MKLIDADALWMEFIHRMDYCDDILEIVDEMPEAVVRCKDCAIAQHDELFGQWYCNGREVKPGDYCSYGERRDG